MNIRVIKNSQRSYNHVTISKGEISLNHAPIPAPACIILETEVDRYVEVVTT